MESRYASIASAQVSTGSTGTSSTTTADKSETNCSPKLGFSCIPSTAASVRNRQAARSPQRSSNAGADNRRGDIGDDIAVWPGRINHTGGDLRHRAQALVKEGANTPSKKAAPTVTVCREQS